MKTSEGLSVFSQFINILISEIKPHPLGCGCLVLISEYPKNKCLSQTTHFSVWWHIVFLIFIYFATVLIKINALDLIGLMISAFGIIMGLIASIISSLEK